MNHPVIQGSDSNMQFIDLARQQQRVRSKIETNIQAVLNHGQYIMGPEVRELEEKLAFYVGTGHAIACASGTDALLLALMAYDVGPGDAIFTSPFTFIATAAVISLLGATPVFVDIDSETFNINPDKLELTINALKANDAELHPLPLNHYSLPINPKGLIAIDLFGLPADYERINSVARKNGLFVVEDAAQSFGAEHNGVKACSLGDIACTSFFPAKPLGCYGDGGMCFTDNDNLSEIIRSLRVHGKGSDKYANVRIGINGRLDTFQAAILLAKFEIFPEEIELRRQVADRYGDLLASCSMISSPCVPEGYNGAWAQYSILAQSEDFRSILMAKLKDAGVPTAIYYPKPLHLQKAFANLGYKERDFPISEDCSNRIFSLPMHPYLKVEEQERIANIISNG